jgi:hypothetical protein
MSLYVLTYPYSRGLSSSVARHFVRSLGAHAFGADVPDRLTLGLREADAPDPSSSGSREADVPDPLPLGLSEAAVSFSSASR